MKFCKDCEYCVGVEELEVCGFKLPHDFPAKCTAPPNIKHCDKVTGQVPDCRDMRNLHPGRCGPDAHWFKPKEPDEKAE